jgi:Na+/H+-translocating membrane pyrophosphatase
MTPLIIICSIVISMLAGALFYTIKQPSNPRKTLQYSVYSGVIFTAVFRVIATTSKANLSTVAFIGLLVAIVICFFLGWSYIGMRKEKKEST